MRGGFACDTAPLRGKLAIMATNAVLPGPTSKRVSENIERLRKLRGLSQAQLANKLTKAGRPMLDTAISKIERGTRRVDVDDLVALALALNVSPAALLMPEAANSQKIALTGEISLASQTAWLWAVGDAPASDLLLDPVAEHTEEEHSAYWNLRQDFLNASHPSGRFSPARALTRTFATLRAEIDRLMAIFESPELEHATNEDFEQQTSKVANWLNLLNADVDQVVAALRRQWAFRRAMPVRHPGVPMDEAIPLEQFRNNPDGPYPRTLELRDLGIEDPDQS